MENELRNHKKSDATKWWLTLIAFLLMGITLLGLLTGIIVPLQNKESDGNSSAVEETQESKTYDGVETRFVNTRHVRLMSETPVTYAANGAYVEKTLTATVLPATATNKKVDWSVAWGSGQTGTVTNYVTVTPSSDGSTTASVKCYQAFTGNIVVTVTTRESGYTAECIVTFQGVPSDIAVSGDIGQSGDGFYYLGVGGTYTYDVDLTNIFGAVGDEYFDALTVTLGAVGSVVLGDCEYHVSSDAWEWYDDTNTTVALSTLVDKFLAVSYSDAVLSITTKKAVESYYEKMERIDAGRTRYYTKKFREYASDEAYFTIRLSVPGTNANKYLKISFNENVVASVQVSSSEIFF